MFSIFRLLAPPSLKYLQGVSTYYGIRLYADSVSTGCSRFHILIHVACYGLILYIVASLLILFTPIQPVFAVLCSVFLLLLLQRFSPLSGINGAKHMVIHAIRQGVPLTLEEVRNMPVRYWQATPSIPAVLLAISVEVALVDLFPNPYVVLLCLVLMVLSACAMRSISYLGQHFFLCKRPTDEQLQEAIAVGIEFLYHFELARRASYGR